MIEKSYDDMSLSELEEEFEHAIFMANTGRDHEWVQVINNLGRRIDEKKGTKK